MALHLHVTTYACCANPKCRCPGECSWHEQHHRGPRVEVVGTAGMHVMSNTAIASVLWSGVLCRDIVGWIGGKYNSTVEGLLYLEQLVDVVGGDVPQSCRHLLRLYHNLQYSSATQQQQRMAK